MTCTEYRSGIIENEEHKNPNVTSIELNVETYIIFHIMHMQKF